MTRLASSVSEMWRVPSRESAECSGTGNELGVVAVVTSVEVSTEEVTVSWMVTLEQSGAAGTVGEITVTGVVTATDFAVTDSLLSPSRLMASSVSEMWSSVPRTESVECTGARTEIGVEVAVVTSVVASTEEVTVSRLLKVEQSSATGQAGEITVTEVVTAAP